VAGIVVRWGKEVKQSGSRMDGQQEGRISGDKVCECVQRGENRENRDKVEKGREGKGGRGIALGERWM